MKEKSICFTGHRVIAKAKRQTIESRLKERLTEFINGGYCRFLAGGALGFDTLAANSVLELKEDFPDIKLVLVLPCLAQTKGWKSADVAEYERIKSLADEVIYTSEEYTSGCMHKRNRRLVDESSVCIAYLEKQSGGTFYTVNYAEKNGVRVVNVAEG